MQTNHFIIEEITEIQKVPSSVHGLVGELWARAGYKKQANMSRKCSTKHARVIFQLEPWSVCLEAWNPVTVIFFRVGSTSLPEKYTT